MTASETIGEEDRFRDLLRDPTATRQRPDLFGMTDPGVERTVNEDQFLIGEIERSMLVLGSSRPVDSGQKIIGSPLAHVFIVADGIGGHVGGKVASAVVTDTMAQYSFLLMPWELSRPGQDRQDLADAFRNAVFQAQAMVRNVAEREGIDHRLGTTLTAAFVTWPDLYVVHVGDSRLYAHRNRLYRVTRDHTMAQELVDKEVMSPERARRSRFGNMLANAVGGSEDDLEVDLHYAELAPRDILLLCTDGLTTHVLDVEIERTLVDAAGGRSVEQCVRELVESARKEGGSDNITVVMARY